MSWAEAALVAGAWFGGALALLSDGRRGLASGLALCGLAVAAALAATPAVAAGMSAAVLLASAARWWRGSPGWETLGPGSTPRLLLSFLALGITILVGFRIVPVGLDPERLVGMCAALLGAFRVLTSPRDAQALTGLSLLALGVGALGAGTPAVWGGAGAVVLISLMPSPLALPEA